MKSIKKDDSGAKPDLEFTPEATENLVGFFRVLLEVDRRLKRQGKVVPRNSHTKVPQPVQKNPHPDLPPLPASLPTVPPALRLHNISSSEPFQLRRAQDLSKVLTIRLDPEILSRLKALGHEKGIGPSTLVRMWVMERVAA